MLIRYEKSGSPILKLSPRILLYPTLLVENMKGIVFTVIDAEDPIQLPLSRSSDNGETLTAHFAVLAASTQRLLDSCSTALGFELAASPLVQFPGFSQKSLVAASENHFGVQQTILIRPIRSTSDHWLAVVGESMHYIFESPRIACRFHEWVECRADDCAIGDSAINVPVTDTPRSFFIDAASHHCANRTVIDRRHERCHLEPIDSRTCCKVCVYHDLCWSADETSALPCGT